MARLSTALDSFELVDLGRLDYVTTAAIQRHFLELVATGEAPSTLIAVEHDPVLTLGANFHEENLLMDADQYEKLGIDVQRTERGGDVTFHGPGQLVLYPLFDVARCGKDLHRWMRDLEETMIRTAAAFGLQARRFPPHTGAWIGDRKLAAIGVKVRKWVSMHGIALNCENDLEPFNLIVPCGIQGYGVTSLSLEAGYAISYQEVLREAVRAFESVFDATADVVDRTQWLNGLQPELTR